MSNDDAWHVRIPRRLRASVDKIAIAEDRHPAQVVRRLLIKALSQYEQRNPEAAVAVISRGELVWLLNCADPDSLATKVDELADLIELGDLYFDADYNLHASMQGRAKLRVLPRATD